jgi:ABC-type nitrate/sulfonate/bicarbonate transport system ATPase subunit
MNSCRDNILKLENIHKSFVFRDKPVLVLEDICLDVVPHSFISIIGPSGCGKSTLLELIAGITHPDSGHIYHYGIDITKRAGYAGYMPQDDLLLPWLTLLENALLPCRIAHKDITRSRIKALELLPDFGLDGFDSHYPWQLSGGMRQRTAFLRTVMTEADILLLDEPFANLDALTRLQMQKWLATLQTKLRQTILLVTHDIDEAIRLSDIIYVMDKQPGTMIYQTAISSEVRNSETDISHPHWLELKNYLTMKLI